jgi:hypothetical protein
MRTKQVSGRGARQSASLGRCVRSGKHKRNQSVSTVVSQTAEAFRAKLQCAESTTAPAACARRVRPPPRGRHRAAQRHAAFNELANTLKRKKRAIRRAQCVVGSSSFARSCREAIASMMRSVVVGSGVTGSMSRSVIGAGRVQT